MTRERALVAALLSVVLLGQAAAVTQRIGGGDRVAGGAIGPGPGMVVSDALLSDGRVRRATVTSERYRPPSQALYGEAGLDDPLAGRMLAVGSAFDDAVPAVPTARTAGFRAVDVAGRRAAVGRDRAWTWVTWDLPDCNDECQGYAVGRNLSEPEVLAAARGATADREAPMISADALPPGLGHLVTGGFDLAGFSLRSTQSIYWTSEKGGLTLAVSADGRLAPVLRFWVDGGPTRVRGQVGSAGPMAEVGPGGPYEGRAWTEGGRALLVVSYRLPDRELERFVTGLRSARGGEWEQVRSRVLDVSSESAIEGCYTPDGPMVAVGRRQGRYRWAVGFRVGRRDQFSHCEVVLTSDRNSLGSSGGPRPVAGEVSVTTTGIGGATDPVGLFVMGVAPPGTARVRVETTDGRTVDAEVADKGPVAGERYYATFLEGDSRMELTVVALDGLGAVLQHGRPAHLRVL